MSAQSYHRILARQRLPSCDGNDPLPTILKSPESARWVGAYRKPEIFFQRSTVDHTFEQSATRRQSKGHRVTIWRNDGRAIQNVHEKVLEKTMHGFSVGAKPLSLIYQNALATLTAMGCQRRFVKQGYSGPPQW